MKNKILLGLLVTVCIFGVGLFVNAQVEKSQLSEINEFAKITDGDKELLNKVLDLLGGSNLLGARQSDIATGFYDVYVENDLSVDGDFAPNGTFTNTATTTPAVNTYYAINETLDLTGTSSAKGATQNVIAYYTNTGDEKLFEWGGLDFEVKNTIFDATYQCGTSTWVGGVIGGSLTTTSSASVIATTTISTTATTITRGTILDSHGDYGSGIADNKTVFPLLNGEVFFCTRTTAVTASATSSDSFDTDKGYTAAGKMLGKIYAR